MASLLVDIGNSRLKWAVASDAGELRVGPAFPSSAAGLEEHLECHWGGLEAPDAVHVANVAGAATAGRLAAWVARQWRLPVHCVRSQAVGYGVTNGYLEPERLGVDRWVGLVALRRDYPLPACLVDCGTALTLDVLDAAGRHLGGLIAPGPALMRRALFQETQGVRPGGEPALDILGRDTASGVAGGIMAACAGLVEKTLAGLAFDRPPTLVLAGGGAAALASALSPLCRLAPDVVLRGLFIIATTEST
ncbi:type III pantothenate kinase [Methylomagnum ishizawai]|uniref:type III pantothenate kinase n=1 Tax=Methylomagnum ishizawai TaxID=1760988 RepID=UPI001C31FB6C|nr:type III pantothenate kinase [Methylomagnum ishizawai]BBL75139.1 type III pantothenate kinase [Methylomagnum ishizawai]